MITKKRNQLIGFITLFLLVLIIAPYLLTDKSAQRNASISLLSSPLSEDNNKFESEQDNNNIDMESEHIDSTSDLDIQQIPSVQQSNDSTIEKSEDKQSSLIAKNDKNYVIQLVALKNKQKIEELVALLRLNNYDVYTDPEKSINDQITRLFVGPYPTKEQAEMVIIDLEHLTKLKGIIVFK